MNEQMMQEWFDEEVSIDTATMQEFDNHIAEYLGIRKKADDLEELLSEINKTKKKMEEKITAYLEAQGKDSHITPMGKINCVTKETWKAPEGPEREYVIEYLKANEAYDAVTAFNANKFHAWFNQEKENNPEFDLPGVAQNSIRYIRFTRAK